MRSNDPIVDEILTYFEQKTGGKRLPSRMDVSPHELKHHLPDICIASLKYDEDGLVKNARMALVGTAVASRYGEMTGKLITAHPSPKVGERSIKAYQMCIESKAPLFITSDTFSKEKAYLKVSSLFVPLSSDNENFDRIFCLVRIKRSVLAPKTESHI